MFQKRNEKMLSVGTACVAAVLTIIFLTQYKRRNSSCNNKGQLKLPPGSSGIFSAIGETLQLFIPTHCLDIHPLVKNKIQRYGPLFRMNVGGHKVIVSTDQGFNHFLFQQEGKLVTRVLPGLFAKESSRVKDPSYIDDIHKYVRRKALGKFGSDTIQRKMLPQLERLINETLRSWSQLQHPFEFKSACLQMFIEFNAKQLFSCDAEKSKELLNLFRCISEGLMSFPLYVPGTSYYRCAKARNRAMECVREAIRVRLASPQSAEDDDLLSKMIKDIDRVKFVSKELITYVLFALLFPSSDTISSPLVFLLKFISDHPAVLKELIAEHEGILNRRTSLDSSITWDEYKSMSFTLQVINETLRMANVVPGLVRDVVKDIHINGYTIPQGWRVMIYHSALHLDPKIYRHPLTFDPWRWKDVETEFIRKNLLPFGEGTKQCVGADFVRVVYCIFLHALITKYRWSIVKGGDIVQDPILRFKNGLHISLHPKPQQEWV